MLISLALDGVDTVSGSTATAVEAVATAATTTTTTVATSNAALWDVSAIATNASASVVTIEISTTFRGHAVEVGSGSGVIVDETGTIVTNAHVIESGSVFTVVMSDGSSLPATVLGVDSDHDLAAIDIDAEDLSPIELGSTTGLLVGNPVVAIGNPLGLEGGPSVSTGIVSALNRTLEDTDGVLSGIIQTDAAITEGSSGGALLDASGNLIGVTTAVGVSSVGIEGIGFAIPVETITTFLDTLTAA
jgi:S1-C subfamily serine protease